MRVDADKQLVHRNSTELTHEQEDYELLLRPGGARRTKTVSSMKSRVIYYSVMLLVGLVGTWLCLWAMFNTDEGEEVISRMGLDRVARGLDEILALLAIPVVMFTAILSLYATQQLYRLYREATTFTSERLNRKRQTPL